MTAFAKPVAIAAVLALFAAGSALAAEACACCKDGAKMECCDKMKDKTPAKPGEPAPPAPEHKH